MESVINDYVSREIVKVDNMNTVCAYLRARVPGKKEAAHG